MESPWATLLLVAAIVAIGCASHRHAGSPSGVPRDDEHVAILNVHPGKDNQAQILSFDGVPFDAFAGRHARPGDFRIPLRPGVHEVRVVVPGPCTYYDGRPGPGSSLSTLRFSARAGTEYEVTMASFPNQLFTLTQVHVYEVVKAPYEFRAVEQATAYEPDPSSCPNGRGLVPQFRGWKEDSSQRSVRPWQLYAVTRRGQSPPWRAGDSDPS